METVNIRLLNDNAKVPKKGTEYSAGYDLYSVEETEIKSGETKLIGTGIAAEIPNGYFGGVFARSGLAVKEGLRPANCVAVIDSDYRGEIKVSLHNDSKEDRVITEGERIAQLIIIPFLSVQFNETETLSETGRGEGGFGSTGKA